MQNGINPFPKSVLSYPVLWHSAPSYQSYVIARNGLRIRHLNLLILQMHRYFFIFRQLFGRTSMVGLVCLHVTLPHYHHTGLYESIELPKCLSGTLCRVCVKIQSILSIIFHAIFGGRGTLYVFSLPILLWLWEYVYFISLSSSKAKYEQFCHYQGLCHETRVCTVCLSRLVPDHQKVIKFNYREPLGAR